MKDQEAHVIARELGGVHGRLDELGKVMQVLKAPVIESGSWIYDASGIITRAYEHPFKAIAVENQTATAIVVVAGPSAGQAPAAAQAQGPGVFTLAAGAAAVYNVSAYAVTLYGTAGGSAVLQVFSCVQPCAWR